MKKVLMVMIGAILFTGCSAVNKQIKGRNIPEPYRSKIGEAGLYYGLHPPDSKVVIAALGKPHEDTCSKEYKQKEALRSLAERPLKSLHQHLTDREEVLNRVYTDSPTPGCKWIYYYPPYYKLTMEYGFYNKNGWAFWNWAETEEEVK